MAETLTYAIELAVGLACLGAAVATLRRPGLRWAGALLSIAGALAVVHAAARLLG